MTWAEIAVSPQWRAFWESEEVQSLISNTENLLLNGRHESVATYQALQVRLKTIAELRALPERLANRDKNSKDAAFQAAAEAAAEAAVLPFPRID